MKTEYVFLNALVYHDGQLIQKDVAVSNGLFSEECTVANPVDLSHYILAPGFIDLQVHGAFGIDFSRSIEMLPFVQQRLPPTGVTSFLASLVSLDAMNYVSLPKEISCHGSCCLGFHIEGPIINPVKAGAHSLKAINKGFDQQFWNNILSLNHLVKMVTLAPEVEGAMDLISYLVDHSIRVSVGHTEATDRELFAAVQRGVTCATHLYNAMKPFDHRHPGPIDFVLGEKSVLFTLIADGLHVSDMALKLAYNAYPEGVILISDASALMGFEGTSATLGCHDIISYNKGSYLKDCKTLAGGASNLHSTMCHFIKATGCSITQALEMVTSRPARFLGVDHKKGYIKTGADADFVILNPQNDYEIVATFIAGKCAYKNTKYNVGV